MQYANDLNPLYTFTHAFAISSEHCHAKYMANLSKMQLSLFYMEQHQLLRIAVAPTFMRLKTHIKRCKHPWLLVHDTIRVSNHAVETYSA